MILTGTALELPPRLTRARRSLERLLLEVLEPSEVRLGGGTVLAARYGHRTSHDLDYWYSNAARRRLNEQGNDYVWEMMVGREAQLDPARTSLIRGCAGTIGGVEFGLSPSMEDGWSDPGQATPRKPDESRINSGNPGRENHKPVGNTGGDNTNS